MLDVAFAIPGDLDAPTGGYAYARKVLQLLPAFDVTPHHIALPAGFPDPGEDDLGQTRRLLDQLHPETPILFDGLAYGALPAALSGSIASPVIALVHHPLARETGLDDLRRRQLEVSERTALGHAAAVIATSAHTRRLLVSDYGVEEDKLTIAEPGTEPARRASGTGRPFRLLTVGALIPRKGYTVLIEALGQLGDDSWHLTIVGSPDHDPAEANRIREHVMASGLRRQIDLRGVVPAIELERLYDCADLFVMPSLYEGYGMVLAEAMAHGLAIVCTTGGAAAETVPDDAAIKVAPDNAPQLADAIGKLLTDAAERERLAECAWQAGCRLPRWPDTAERIANVIKTIAGEKGQ